MVNASLLADPIRAAPRETVSPPCRRARSNDRRNPKAAEIRGCCRARGSPTGRERRRIWHGRSDAARSRHQRNPRAAGILDRPRSPSAERRWPSPACACFQLRERAPEGRRACWPCLLANGRIGWARPNVPESRRNPKAAGIQENPGSSWDGRTRRRVQAEQRCRAWHHERLSWRGDAIWCRRRRGRLAGTGRGGKPCDSAGAHRRGIRCGVAVGALALAGVLLAAAPAGAQDARRGSP